MLSRANLSLVDKSPTRSGRPRGSAEGTADSVQRSCAGYTYNSAPILSRPARLRFSHLTLAKKNSTVDPRPLREAGAVHSAFKLLLYWERDGQRERRFPRPAYRTSFQEVSRRFMRGCCDACPPSGSAYLQSHSGRSLCGLRRLPSTQASSARSAHDQSRQCSAWLYLDWMDDRQPTIGGLIVGLGLTYLAPAAAGSGIPQVKVAYTLRAGLVTVRETIGKFILCAFQIGSGASLGLEGLRCRCVRE